MDPDSGEGWGSRRCETFLCKGGVLLGDLGYTLDLGCVKLTDSTIVFYHYTRVERADRILEPGSGLWARLPIVSAPPDIAGCHLTEGLLEPLPLWMTDSPYFGDLRLEMLRELVGDLLLRVKVPREFPGLYVADYAHRRPRQVRYGLGNPALPIGIRLTALPRPVMVSIIGVGEPQWRQSRDTTYLPSLGDALAGSAQ